MNAQCSKRIVATIAALVVSFTSIRAQQTIEGVVRDSGSREPVAGAFVLGLSDSTQKAFCYSDEDGLFVLVVPKGAVIDELKVTMLGYSATSVRTLGRTSGFLIELKEDRREIKASKVVASAAEEARDTLRYYANAFKDGTEKSVGDILNKIPGITVSSAGTVRHNGKTINKFYVEGMDLMGGRYGIVTNNLDAEHIARIEVYQNHQPINALQGISVSDRSAVNIILKEDARNSWLFSGDAVLGLPEFPLFEARAMASVFSKRYQSLLLLKGNNTGKDILAEIRPQSYYGKTGAFRYTPENIESDFSSKLNPRRNSIALPAEYWFDNLSGIGSFNYLKTIKDGSQVRFVSQVAAERFDEHSVSTETMNFADGSVLSIIDDRNMLEKRLYGSAGLTFEKNESDRYIQDEFSVSGQIRDNSSSFFGSRNVSQLYDLPSFKMANDLRMVLRGGEKKTWNVGWSTKYLNNNHSATYNIGGDEPVGQLFNFRSFTTKPEISRNISLKRHKLKFSAGARLSYSHWETTESISTTSVTASASIHDSFSIGTARLSASLPVSLEYISIKGGESVCFPITSPSVALEYKLGQRMKMIASSSYDLTRSGEESMLREAVRSDYRTLAAGDSLMQTASWRNMATLQYSDMGAMLFGTLAGSWNWRSDDKRLSSTYIGQLLSQTYLPVQTATSGWSVSASVKKYFGVKTFVVEGEAGYSSNRVTEYLQGASADFENNTIRYKVTLGLNPSDWLVVNASCDYSKNSVSGNSSPKTERVQVDGLIKVKPVKRLALEVDGRYLWTKSTGATFSNTPLLKATVSWSLDRATLFVECRNLLDAREYRYESVSAYRTYSYVTSLCGRRYLAGIRMSL